MLKKNTHIKRGTAKTLLIILGVLIALFMSINSPMFTTALIPASTHIEKSGVTNNPPESDTHSKGGSASASKYNSATRMLHIFTKNLPYLNHK